MSRIAGTAEVYTKEAICEQMRSEVIGAFQNVLNELGTEAHKVPVLELPSSTDEIKKTMDEKVFDQPIRDRGLSIVGFVIESVTLDAESEKKIDNYELSSNSFMQQGALVGAYANAVQDAANNANGSMNGFMGVGMMNMASGGMFGGVTNNATNNGPVHQAYAEGHTPSGQPLHTGVVAHGENAENLDNNAAAPATPMAFCPECGTKNGGTKFCPNCGTKLV
jgi:membrane protease subunit (stomatin/prohibitin family)